MLVSRRRLMVGSLLGSAAALAGCATASSGGTSSITIDVARINTDGQSIVTSVTSLLGAPAVVALLGAANVALVQTYLADIRTQLANVNAASGGAVTLTVNTATVQGFVNALLADANRIVTLVRATLPSLAGSTVLVDVENALAIIGSLLPFIQAAAALVVTTGPATMTEQQAVSAAHAL